jgi:superfamily II DNA or RNA helicase
MANFSFIIKDPNKAYLGTQMWLPRKKINVIRIKAALEFESYGGEGLEYLQLWEDTPHHLAVPREFVPKEDYAKLSFPIVDIRPTDFPDADIKSNLILDFMDPEDDTQKKAFSAFMKVDGGILNLSCGKGKTCVALHAAAHYKKNTLIIVNQKTIFSQWEGAVNKFIDLNGGQVGHIQGAPSKWDWRHPITVATIQTLAKHADHVTPEMRKWFGLVIWDEVHHLSAPYFCITSTMFGGRRYGLSATVNREDGTEVIYNYHVGEVFYKDLSQEVKPTIRFRRLETLISASDWLEYVVDKSGNPNIGLLRSFTGQMPSRNAAIARDIRDGLKAGRKILALSHSVKQLELMYELFLAEGADVGICTGKQEVAKRWAALRDKQLIFGTHQLVLEAIDEDSLDTLMWLTPFGSKHPNGGKNALQQGMGRIQGYRYREGMKNPLVVIFDDIYVNQFHRMCNKLRAQLTRWPSDEGGPYEHITLKQLEEEEEG